MSDEEILAVVREHCVRVLKVDPARVTPEARLRIELDADSLDLAELHVSMEERCGPIPRETLARAQTVGDLLEQVRELVREPAR